MKVLVQTEFQKKHGAQTCLNIMRSIGLLFDDVTTKIVIFFVIRGVALLACRAATMRDPQAHLIIHDLGFHALAQA